MAKVDPLNPLQTIHVKIQTPNSIVWEGEADIVSSINSSGAFDVLPDHANMITIVEKTPIQITSQGGNRNFTFEKAIISLQDNNLHVYANIEPAQNSGSSTNQANT